MLDKSRQPTEVPGPSGIRPSDGLYPVSPHQEEGIRIEPPPSEPVASGTIPVAKAAALPPEDPPGVRSLDHGFLVAPKRRLSVTPFHPSSGVLVLPTTTAPEALRRPTRNESFVANLVRRKDVRPERRPKPARVFEIFDTHWYTRERPWIFASGYKRVYSLGIF